MRWGVAPVPATGMRGTGVRGVGPGGVGAGASRTASAASTGQGVYWLKSKQTKQEGDRQSCPQNWKAHDDLLRAEKIRTKMGYD